ncbi:MAG: gas vesicle protein K [Planctomycetota bacterium]
MQTASLDTAPFAMTDASQTGDAEPTNSGDAPAQTDTAGPGPSINLDQENVGRGLAQLVLTVVRLLHELLEKQAIRRMDAGSLSDEEIERLGTTLRAQAEEITRTAERFDIDESDLTLDLGPLGRVV